MHGRKSKITFAALLVVCVALVAAAPDYTWPERGTDPYPWPNPKEASKILYDRFLQASTNALGTAEDIKALQQAIAAHKAPLRVEVRDVRWLSPSLVMAYTRTEFAAYYYVTEKKKGKWSVLSYYMLWVT